MQWQLVAAATLHRYCYSFAIALGTDATLEKPITLGVEFCPLNTCFILSMNVYHSINRGNVQLNPEESLVEHPVTSSASPFCPPLAKKHGVGKRYFRFAGFTC